MSDKPLFQTFFAKLLVIHIVYLVKFRSTMVAIMNLYFEEGARCPHAWISGSVAIATMIFVFYHIPVSFPL
jgi:hypothetical protein